MKFLHKLLKLFWLKKQKEFKREWNRSLPFSEYVVDRWERASSLGFGKGSSIYDNSVVLGQVEVGCNTWIGPFVILDGSSNLSIGSNCSISAGVHIYTHDTVKWANSGGSEEYEYASTEIGDNCYIGPNSIVTKGVTIGEGSIVGANSFVSSDVEPGSRVAGNPARKI